MEWYKYRFPKKSVLFQAWLKYMNRTGLWGMLSCATPVLKFLWGSSLMSHISILWIIFLGGESYKAPFTITSFFDGRDVYIRIVCFHFKRVSVLTGFLTLRIPQLRFGCHLSFGTLSQPNILCKLWCSLCKFVCCDCFHLLNVFWCWWNSGAYVYFYVYLYEDVGVYDGHPVGFCVYVYVEVLWHVELCEYV